MIEPYDWHNAKPSAETLLALRAAKDEDFPNTYSATAWKAAKRILDAIPDSDRLRILDPWNLPKEAREAIAGLDLTGFMVGYACSAIRMMLGVTPGKSGAVVIIGQGVADQPPITGSPESELSKALGGEADEPANR